MLQFCLEAMLQHLEKQLEKPANDDCDGCLDRVKHEEATEVWVLIPDVLHAAVALSGPGEARAVTAAVYGPEEVCTTERDAWGTSDHVVFR